MKTIILSSRKESEHPSLLEPDVLTNSKLLSHTQISKNNTKKPPQNLAMKAPEQYYLLTTSDLTAQGSLEQQELNC